MKTPSFWYQPYGVFSALLWPISWVYEKSEKALRAFKKPQRFPIPIISVGNIVCGGAGKTPIAISLASLLQKKGIKVHFLTRGYGSNEKGPLEVNALHHTSLDVGDEPLLLSHHAPTWIAKKRPLGVLKIIERGADVIILDDGHQTTSLYKDLSFVVIDQLQKFGNKCVIPAGPLRENLREGLNRADALISIGDENISSSQPLFRARVLSETLSLPTQRAVAFCGLGFPQKFYKTLTNLGIELIAQETFPDHYRYKETDLIRLHQLAKDQQAVLITTRKDFVRIPPSWQKNLHVLDIKIQFEDEERIIHFIHEKIPSLKEIR